MNEERKEKARQLVEWLAAMPTSSDHLSTTWNPPEWEQVVEWWDRAVDQAREACPHIARYREYR